MTILSVGCIIISCEFSELPEIAISQDFITHVAKVNFITNTSDDAAGALVEDLDKTVITISRPDAGKVYIIEGKKSFISQLVWYNCY